MTAKKCEHYWSYTHAIYAGMDCGVSIRRWCDKCKAKQVADIAETQWRPEGENGASAEFDHEPWEIECVHSRRRPESNVQTEKGSE